jgi:hypothetical protein
LSHDGLHLVYDVLRVLVVEQYQIAILEVQLLLCSYCFHFITFILEVQLYLVISVALNQGQLFAKMRLGLEWRSLGLSDTSAHLLNFILSSEVIASSLTRMKEPMPFVELCQCAYLGRRIDCYPMKTFGQQQLILLACGLVSNV